MSLLDDELILEENTDINNPGKMAQPNEYLSECSTEYVKKSAYDEYYKWGGDGVYMKYVMPDKLKAFKNFNINLNKNIKSKLITPYHYDISYIKVSYGIHNNNRQLDDKNEITDNYFDYNYIKISMVLKKQEEDEIININNSTTINNGFLATYYAPEMEEEIFKFMFWFPFVEMEDIRPYAYALYKSIFNNPKKLNILNKIKYVEFNEINKHNLEKFYYEFII